MKEKIHLNLILGSFLLLQTAITSASPIAFNINQTFTQGNVSDISTTSISLGGAGNFNLDPGNSGNYFDFTFSGSGNFATISTSVASYSLLDSYSLGETVGISNFGNFHSHIWDTILANNQTGGVWGASHNGYLGFISDSNSYGWIEYSFTRTTSSTLTLLNGAYNDVANADIIAGGVSAVPAPAAIWLMGSGLIGLIGMKKRSSKLSENYV